MKDKLFRLRKFTLTLLVLVGSFIALFLDKLTGPEMVTLIPLILGIFVGGNVTEKFSPRVKENGNT